jgi:hypothetical protein
MHHAIGSTSSKHNQRPYYKIMIHRRITFPIPQQQNIALHIIIFSAGR